MRRYLRFSTSFKDIRESPSTNNHDASTPRFPNLMVCNYQSHSRMKIKEKFPNVHWKQLASLYQTDVNSTQFGDDINDIDAKQFGIQTRPNITFVGCKIGDIDCKAHWRAILTPYGACYVMKITNDETYMTQDPFNQANSVLGLVVAINKTDSSFGWHGLRTGVSLYYFHWTHPQSESRELSLTTDMSMYAQLVMTREKYLGKPFSVCSNEEDANRCYHRKTEQKIQSRCDCHYGLLNKGNPDNLRECTFGDMFSCVNSIIQEFIFSRDSSLEDQCPPQCLSFDFKLKQVMYRDKNTKAIALLRDKSNIPDEMEVYVVELELVTDEIDAVEEIEDYPTGEMLSDLGGVFGFFLGLSMINCAEYFLCKLPTKMMTCCKRNDKSKLLDEDSDDEGNFVKQSDIKQKTLLDPKSLEHTLKAPLADSQERSYENARMNSTMIEPSGPSSRFEVTIRNLEYPRGPRSSYNSTIHD